MPTENRKYKKVVESNGFGLWIFIVRKEGHPGQQIETSNFLFSLLSMFDGILFKTFRYLEN